MATVEERDQQLAVKKAWLLVGQYDRSTSRWRVTVTAGAKAVVPAAWMDIELVL